MDGVRTAEVSMVLPPATHWWLDDAALTSSELSPAVSTLEPPHQFPPLSTGRDVCTLTCVLQI